VKSGYIQICIAAYVVPYGAVYIEAIQTLCGLCKVDFSSIMHKWVGSGGRWWISGVSFWHRVPIASPLVYTPTRSRAHHILDCHAESPIEHQVDYGGEA